LIPRLPTEIEQLIRGYLMPTVEVVKHNHENLIREINGHLHVLGPGIGDDLLPTYIELANDWREIQNDMRQLMEYLHRQ
jgi:hypothetical protein